MHWCKFSKPIDKCCEMIYNNKCIDGKLKKFALHNRQSFTLRPNPNCQQDICGTIGQKLVNFYFFGGTLESISTKIRYPFLNNWQRPTILICISNTMGPIIPNDFVPKLPYQHWILLRKVQQKDRIFLFSFCSIGWINSCGP